MMRRIVEAFALIKFANRQRSLCMSEKFTIEVPSIYKNDVVTINLTRGINVFIGPNGSGKTQVLKALKRELQRQKKAVRYLSSNRIGTMEMYRSRTNQFNYDSNDYTVGDKRVQLSRLEVETATGDFMSMDAEHDLYIKVATRLSALFNRKVYLRWDSGNLKVYFEKVGSGGEYPVTVEASGLVNLISILAAIYETSLSYLFIDEPEVSLHPQLQAYLMREIRNACAKTGKTVVISTHSVDMIDLQTPDDFCRLVFFAEEKMPKQLAENEEVLKNKKLREFILRMNQTYKAGFFAKRILLLEGVSDMLVCKGLAAKLNLNIDTSGTQIIPVDGKGQFPIVAKLFSSIGKDVSILTDLDGFTDDESVVSIFNSHPRATELANQSGVKSLSELTRGVKTTLQELIKRNDKEVFLHYSRHPYWVKEGEIDVRRQELVKRRAVVASLFCNAEHIADWPDCVEWKSLAARLESIFDKFAQVGCFVLRKGAIESYYKHSSNTEYDDKPSKAIEEVAGIWGMNESDVRDGYKDIVSALDYVADYKTIDEGDAVRQELLSELPVLINELQVKGKGADINSLLSAIKAAKGSISQIFAYAIDNVGEKVGIKVSLAAKSLSVTGFPLVVFVDDNVNDVVMKKIKSI